MAVKVRSIQNEEDYDEMVHVVDTLIDAEPGTEAYETLQIASDLVWAWEQKHVEILPPDPIEAIKFRLESRGSSLRDLRPYIGTDARIAEVMSGKRDLTLKMVRALNKHLDIPLESLVNDRMELDEDPEVGKYPIAEMMKLGWLGDFTDPKAGYEEEAWKWFRDKAHADQFQPAALCRENSQSYANAKTDLHALYAWCLRVRVLAFADNLQNPYIAEAIDDDFLADLAHFSRFDDGPALAKEKLNGVGIHLIIAKHLRSTYLDGAAMLMNDGTRLIGMTLRHDRLDNFWHCLLHECVHVVRHLGQNNSNFFQDDFDLRGDLNDVESEADRLAGDALIPDDAIDGIGNLAFLSTGDVREIAEEYSVHEAVVAGRIRYRTGNYAKFAKQLGYKEPSRILGEPK